MSQIKAPFLFSVMLTFILLTGCGDTNPQVSFSSNGGGSHQPDWATVHKATAKTNLDSCAGCHGENLNGGIARISCSSCHLGGSASIHPLMWGQYAYGRHISYVATNGITSCSNAACHGAGLAGVAGSGPACATACHMGGTYAKHPALWTQYSSHGNYMKSKAYNAASCSLAACHGVDAKGVFLSGPSCFACHPADPTVLAPVPDKHPHNLINASNHFVHNQYVLSYGISSCNTNFCHGTGGPGPSCLTAGCHN